MEIVWTTEGHQSFFEIIDFIERKFTEREVNNFIQDTFETIEAIKNYPDLFPATKLKVLKSTRKVVIHPHTTLFYQATGKQIVILLFWDNRRDLGRRK